MAGKDAAPTHRSQADLYEPSPSCFCSWSAAMPLEWVAIRYTAQNQTVSGSFEPCITVPAVTDVCLPQPAHSQVDALVASSQPLPWPQCGQPRDCQEFRVRAAVV